MEMQIGAHIRVGHHFMTALKFSLFLVHTIVKYLVDLWLNVLMNMNTQLTCTQKVTLHRHVFL